MTIRIDPKAWTEGFKDAYAAKPKPAEDSLADGLSYASGRVEGEALRLKHQEEYERGLLGGRRVRPVSPGGASRG